MVSKIMDCKSETQTKTLEVRQLPPLPHHVVLPPQDELVIFLNLSNIHVKSFFARGNSGEW